MPARSRRDPAAATTSTDQPQAVVESFLAEFAARDLAAAGSRLADDLVYTNVGLLTVRGSRRAIKLLSPFARGRGGFEVYFHAVSADGPTVLTERTDVLTYGPLRVQFWVWGRFDVHDGRITLWRDSFDYLDVTRGLLRGLLGVAVPPLRPSPPAGAATPPGRH